MFLSDYWYMRIKRSLLYVVSLYTAAHTLLPALVQWFFDALVSGRRSESSEGDFCGAIMRPCGRSLHRVIDPLRRSDPVMLFCYIHLLHN